MAKKPSKRLRAIMDEKELNPSATVKGRRQVGSSSKAETKYPDKTGRGMKGDDSISAVTAPKGKKKVMSASKAAKKARSGADMGKPGKNFNKVATKAAKEYGSAAAGKRVAGSIFQKMRKAGKL